MNDIIRDQQSGEDGGTAWLSMVEARDGGLRIDRFVARPGEVWCVWGANRSGVDRFTAFFRRRPGDSFSCAALDVPADLSVVSFRDQQEIYEQEVRNDESDFLDRLDPGTPARNFLSNLEENRGLIQQFGLEPLLDSGYRQLSSGECRKLLILKAITEGARHLLIESPYDGLDVRSCAEFDRIMELLVKRRVGVILVLSSRSDIPAWCTHLAWIENGVLTAMGPLEEMLEQIDWAGNGDDWKTILEDQGQGSAGSGQCELITLVDGHARYGERTIFSGLDFRVREGQHTLVTGPNGAGKSTLLGLVSGDHQDCYCNELYLFGNRRGSGESIWEIKKEMGIVSPALHREHYVPGSCLQIVASGFFDSIGLYRRPTQRQVEQARAWLGVVGLGELQKTPFRRVGFAEQRLVLIARALIKLPKLLILDEPTQGLDDANRKRLLDFLEVIADRRISTIVYVSHRRDEFRSFFRQHIDFEQLDPSFG